jgi:hypothetical protein
MHVSAALDILVSQNPDLMQHAKPFGMSIGVEVFALANNPLIDAYPALQKLVLSFKSQFLELGIDPRMVRRATDLHVRTEKVDEASEKGEAQLRAWLGDWLGSINKRKSRGAEWLLSSQQIQELLGPDIYPYASAESSTGKEAGPQPTRAHLERIKDILGPHILNAMLKIWTSPHTRVFANPLIADVDDFEAYATDVERLEAGNGEGEDEAALDLETLFPSPRRMLAWTRDMEDKLQMLEKRGRRRPLSFQEQLQLSEARGRKSWLGAVAESGRADGEVRENEVEGGLAVGKWE